MTTGGGKDATGIQAHSWRPLRWIVLLVTLIAFGAATLSWHRECTVVELVEPNSDITTTTTCAPPTLTSAAVLVLLLFVVLLLWPDISEVTVLGVSLKRKMEAVAKEATEAKGQVAALTQLTQSLQVQITSVATSAAAAAAASATVSQNFILPDLPWSPRASSRVEKSIPELQQELRDLTASGVGFNLETVRKVDDARVHSEYDGLSDSELKMRLIVEWERFDNLLDIHNFRRPQREEQFPEREVRRRRAQRGFIADYQDTISGVRSLRNAVAHGRVVERDDVLKGLQALELMTPLAQAWLRERETDLD